MIRRLYRPLGGLMILLVLALVPVTYYTSQPEHLNRLTLRATDDEPRRADQEKFISYFPYG